VAVGEDAWKRFSFVSGSTEDASVCGGACGGVDYVLHQAALGSVPRSLEYPRASHEANVTGFLNMLVAARDAKVKRLVYASSSSVYGDEATLPKVEARIGRPLSPYAATKRMNEIYAETFAISYGMETVGLRYFNVFGPRQDPVGPYAAVIPKWIDAMLKDRPVVINGDGETSRDFCYVKNVVQGNLLAATVQDKVAVNEVYNIALNTRTTLNQLFEYLKKELVTGHPSLADRKPVYQEFRRGDVRHSQADISKAEKNIGYSPTHTVERGLGEAMEWYKRSIL